MTARSAVLGLAFLSFLALGYRSFREVDFGRKTVAFFNVAVGGEQPGRGGFPGPRGG